MIGTSLREYIFIRTCIPLLQHSIPLALLSLLLTLALTPSKRPYPLPAVAAAAGLTALVSLDALFALTIYLPFRSRLRREARHPPSLTRPQRRALFRKCLANVPDGEAYLRGWFLRADAADIRRDNVREFFLWAFFDRGTAEAGAAAAIDAETEAELDEYLDRMEDEVLGRRLEDGRGPAACLRLTLDRVETRYRSVAWYAIVGAVDAWTHLYLAWRGFTYRAPPLRKRLLGVFPPRPQLWLPQRASSPSPELGYWFRPHTAASGVPVVFLHGIGIGLWPYAKFLAELDDGGGGRGLAGRTGVLALEILPVSMRLTSEEPLERAEFVDHLARILRHHGWDRFVLVSHSYGSVLTTHMIRDARLNAMIDSVVLVDPVSLLLHLPDVAYNFTRRAPRQANEWQLWYFASMDPGTAHTLGRHFFWRDNVVWKEELLFEAGGDIDDSSGSEARDRAGRCGRKRKVAVSLAGRDLIVDTRAVEKYLACSGDLADPQDGQDASRPANGAAGTEGSLQDGGGAGDAWESSPPVWVTKSGIEMLRCPGLDHAQVFDSPKYCHLLSEIVRRYSREGGR